MVTAGRTARSAGGASADVPSSIENVNAEWLTAVLDGGTVTDIRTERIAEDTGQALQALTERSMLLHGDIRADNVFFDGDQLKVVDFQFAARGADSRIPRLPERTRCHGLRVRRGMAPLPICGGLPDDPARDHAQRLRRLAGALPCIVREAHRPRGGDHRRDRRAGGVRMTRSAREVVSCTTWSSGMSAISRSLKS